MHLRNFSSPLRADHFRLCVLGFGWVKTGAGPRWEDSSRYPTSLFRWWLLMTEGFFLLFGERHRAKEYALRASAGPRHRCR
jgi:hypothetical protein